MTNTLIPKPLEFNYIYIHNLEGRHLKKYPEIFLEDKVIEALESMIIERDYQYIDPKTQQTITNTVNETIYVKQSKTIQARKPYLEFKCDNTEQTIKFKYPNSKITLTLHSMNTFSVIDDKEVASFYTV